jgi:hypothetical protein
VNERAIHCSFNETEGLGEVPYRAIGDTGSPLGGDPVLEEAKLSMISGVVVCVATEPLTV